MRSAKIVIESRRGSAALLLASCAGMADLIALPISVGTLIASFGFDPQQAGFLMMLFLGGVVAASTALAPHFPRLPGRAVAAAGYGLSAIGFFWAAAQSEFYVLAVLLSGCGLASGAALTVTNGTIARSARPHRLYAAVSTALGVFGVLLLGATPLIASVVGGQAVFLVLGAVKALAALVALAWFPSRPVGDNKAAPTVVSRIPLLVWFGIAGIAAMSIVHAMTSSFLVQVGAHRGFDAVAVNGVLIAIGLVSLLPGPLSAALETRWPARRVLLGGAVLQVLLVTVVMTAPGFTPYAVAAALFPSVMVFTHTFAFGLLAASDPSGRSLAATPAMLMAGAALGALLGGTLVKLFGFSSIAVAAACLAAFALLCFSRLPSGGAAHSSQEVPA